MLAPAAPSARLVSCSTARHKPGQVTLVVAYVFLTDNGYTLGAPEREAVEVMKAVTAGELSEGALAHWFRVSIR